MGKRMSNESLAIASHEGEVLTENTDIAEWMQGGKDTLSASPAVEETKEELKEEVQTESEEPSETETPSQEGEEGAVTPEETPDDRQIPLHKQPRFQEVIRERNELRERLESLEKERQAINQDPSEIPQWFKTRIGDDPEAWAEYKSSVKAEMQELKSELRREMVEESKAEQEAIRKAEEEIDASLAELEAEGMKFDRNELQKFMVERPIRTEDGRYDFRTALEILELRKTKDQEKLKARKSVAASTLSSNPTGKPQGYATPDTVGTWY